MDKLSVGLDEAGEMTGLSYVTLRRLVKGRRIRATRVGRRVLIPVAELRRFLRVGTKFKTSSR